MDFNIPLEIKNKAAFPQLKKADRLIVAYAVLFGADNQTAFLRFHPEYATERGLSDTGKVASRQFWGYGKIKEYREQYESELAQSLNRATDTYADTNSMDDSRKERAIQSLLSQAMKLVEGAGDLDAETLKIAAEIFKKVGLLKDEVEQQVRPLRFLPERCYSNCRYRLFVENTVKGGDLIDECKYCRALRYATENGYCDDACSRLDIPKEILATEPENTVKTIDILSGKYESQ